MSHPCLTLFHVLHLVQNRVGSCDPRLKAGLKWGQMLLFDDFILKLIIYDVVQEEALYSWMMDLSEGELQISYDKMLLIRDKNTESP